MRRGDIVFVRGKGIISKAILYVDGGKFSHCAVAISDSKVIEAEYDTKVAVREFDRNKYSVIEEIELGVTKSKRMDIYNASLGYIGRKYDFPSLLWYILRKFFKLEGRNRLNNPNNLICSELVFLVLDEIGFLDDMGIEKGSGIDLTPNELYDLVKYASTKKGS